MTPEPASQQQAIDIWYKMNSRFHFPIQSEGLAPSSAAVSQMLIVWFISGNSNNCAVVLQQRHVSVLRLVSSQTCTLLCVHLTLSREAG